MCIDESNDRTYPRHSVINAINEASAIGADYMTDESIVISRKPHVDQLVDEVNPIAWSEWLPARCEVRGQSATVVWYGVANCNYLVFRGRVFTAYGYHGRNTFESLRQAGSRKTLFRRMSQFYRSLDSLGVKPS
jgi:hypothetical protein